MGLLQQAYQSVGKTYTPSDTPTSSGGLLQQAQASIANNPPTSAPIKIAPNATNISQKPNLLDTAINAVKKIGKDITLSFTPPKVPPRLPDSAFQQPKPIGPPKPISITPNQKKIDLNQLKTATGNLVNKAVNKIGNAEQSIFGIKLGSLKSNINDIGAILSGNTMKSDYEAYNKLDAWSKLGETSKVFGALVPMSGLKVIEGAKDVASFVRGLIGGYGVGSVLNYATQDPKKRSIGEAIKPNLDNMLFAYFTGSTGLPNPFEFLKKQPDISKVEYIKARDFLKNLGVKEDVFSKPDLLKKSYFDLALKNHPDKGGNAKTMAGINNAFKIVTDTFYDVKKTGDKPTIAGLLGDGEKTPQEVIGTVLKNNLEKTPEGKELIKSAVEAQQKGQNITIEKQQPSTPQGGVPPVEELPKTKQALNEEIFQTAYKEQQIGDSTNNDLYRDMRKSQDILMKKVEEVKKYKTEADIPTKLKNELDRLKNIWNEKATKWEQVYAPKNSPSVVEGGVSIPKEYKSAEAKIKQFIPEIKTKIVESIPFSKQGGKSLSVSFPHGGVLDFDIKEKDILIWNASNRLKNSSVPKGIGEVTKAIRSLMALAKEENKNITIYAANGSGYWDNLGFNAKDFMNPKLTPKELSKIDKLKEFYTPPVSPIEKVSGGGEVVTSPKKPIIKPQTVSVPASQLPVGEGKLKASKLEARMKGVIGNATPEELETLGFSMSNTAENDQQLSDAAKYLSENKKEAMDVLEGKKDAPKGLLRNTIYVAAVQEAKTDLTLATKLVGLSSKRYGQEIQILSRIDPNSPVKLLNEVYNIREEEFKKSHGGKTVKEVSTNMEKNMEKKANKIKKQTWKNFKSEIRNIVNNIDTC